MDLTPKLLDSFFRIYRAKLRKYEGNVTDKLKDQLMQEAWTEAQAEQIFSGKRGVYSAEIN